MRISKTHSDDNSEKETQINPYRSKAILPTAPLPDPLGQNIEAIIALQAKAEKDVTRQQRLVETVATFFGRPIFLYSILLVVILWVLPNLLPSRLGLPQFDPPPFDWLGRVIN